MPWTPPVRNFNGVQFSELRQTLDQKFNDVHDRLTKAYYDGEVFTQNDLTVDFGKMKKTDPTVAKETFDKLHGLIFLIRDVAFHEANKARDVKSKIPAEQYNFIYDNDGVVIGRKSDVASAEIEKLKNSGIELVI